VKENVEKLKSFGIEFKQDLKVHEDGSYDAIFEDLDRNIIYIDTHPSEYQSQEL
jgi:hypothetical protein